MKYSGLITITLALIVTFAAGQTRADLDDFLVNDDGGISEQNYPRVAAVGDGSFVITWTDKRLGNNDIYLQRFDSAGSTIGVNVRVNDDTLTSYQSEPVISADQSGFYSILWKDFRNGQYPFDSDIYFQRYNSSHASVLTNQNLTPSATDSLKETPDISLSPWGGGVVVWADYRNHNWDIYGQMIGPSGALIGSNFKVNDDAGSAQQHGPRVSVSPEGWFVVAWYDNRSGDDDIYIQRFDSTGTAIGTNWQVNADPGQGRQAFPGIAADGSGHFTVIWVDWRNGSYPSNPDIYAKKFDTLLVAVSTDKLVNTDFSGRAQREPSISVDHAGRAMVVWADSGNVSWDISGRLIDADGTIRQGQFTVNETSDSAQVHPDVAVDGRYRFVTWADKRNGNYDIYANVVKYNDPGLIPSPLSFAFSMPESGSTPSAQSLILNHQGLAPINYEAVCSGDWLQATPATGVTPDTLSISITTDTLSAGTYFGEITLIDTDNDDSTAVVPVRFDVIGQPDDTVTFGTVNVGLGAESILPVELNCGNNIESVSIPLRYDTDAATIDSVVFASSLPDIFDQNVEIRSASGVILLSLQGNTEGSYLSSGVHLVAEIFFTAGNTDMFSDVDTALVDTSAIYLITSDGFRVVPEIVSGQITVGSPTDVGDLPFDLLPDGISLYQNYPNPFNLTTTISYELPHVSDVELKVYNLLGRTVRTLVAGRQSAGIHEIEWDGLSDGGSVVSSGVYFYRLQSDQSAIVRKMVLLK